MRSVLLATGGTIAWSEGEERMLSGADLADRAGLEFDEVADLEPRPSWDLSLGGMQRIAEAVRDSIAAGAEAVVVTHGTDTLEESAWLTELVLGPELRSTAGVVFTGAMRFADDRAADGPANLRQAIQLAAVSAGSDLGVQVAFAGRTHAARWVRKVDASALDCFDSAGRPPSAPRPPSSGAQLQTDVVLLKVGPLCQPALPGAAGLVLEGTGADHVPGRYHAEIAQRLEAGRATVVASRCVDPRPETDPGPGALRARDLTAEKAALALMVGLGAEPGLDALRRWWELLLAAAWRSDSTA